MAWDLKLNSNRDIAPGYVTKNDEVLQRISTRLQREFGEWFLDDTVGIPWYFHGDGLLGSQDNEILDIVIHNTIKDTEGVKRILKFSPAWTASKRDYRYYILLELDDDTQFSAVFTPEGGLEWQQT